MANDIRFTMRAEYGDVISALNRINTEINRMSSRTIRIDVNTNNASNSINNLRNNINNLGNSSNGAGASTGGLFRTIAGGTTVALLAAEAIQKIAEAVKDAIVALGEYNGKMEQTGIAFKTMLGSQQAANAMMADLKKMANDTPFEFPELATAARKLLAFGWAGKDVIPTLKAVGEAVSAMGGGKEELEGVSLALGQIKAKGKVSAEEILQLAERGIPGFQILADKLKLTGDQIGNLGNEGISAEKAIKALTEGMQERFEGSMKAQSDTALGMISTIKDGVMSIGSTLSSGLFGEFKNVLTYVRDFINKITEIIDSGGIAGLFEKMIPAEWQTRIEKIFNVYANAWAKLSPIFSKVSDTASVAMEILIGVLGFVADQFINSLQQMEPVFNLFIKMIENVVDIYYWFATEIKKVLLLIPDAWHKLTIDVSQSWQNLLDGFDAILNTMDNWAKEHMGIMYETIVGGWNWIKGKVKEVTDWMGNKASESALKWTQATTNPFKDWVNSLRKQTVTDADRTALNSHQGTKQIDFTDKKAEATLKATNQAILSSIETTAKLEEDAIKRAGETLDNQYKNNILSIKDYYKQKLDITLASIDREIQKMQELKSVYASQVSGAKEENERISLQQKIIDLDAQIQIKRREQNSERIKSEQLSNEETKKLADDVADYQIKTLQNKGQTAKATEMQLQKELRDIRAKFKANGNEQGLALLDEYENYNNMKAQITQWQADADSRKALLDNTLSQINNNLQNGSLTTVQAEYQRFQAQREYAQEILKNIQVQIDLANVAGDTQLVNKLTQTKLQMQQLNEQLDPMQEKIRGALKSSLEDFFETGINGAKSFGDAFKGILASIASELQKMAAKNLVEQIMGKQGGGGLGDMFGNLFGGLFGGATKKANGGLITGTGTDTSDNIPAWLSPGEFVIKASAVRKFGLDMFSALNNGFMPSSLNRFATGGLVGATPVISGGATTIVNLLDSNELVGSYLNSNAGERKILNIISNNQDKISKLFK